MTDCLFCKIIAGEIPCHKIYEDENVLAFLDIGGITTGHTLVVPKKHYARMTECETEIFEKVMTAVQKISQSYVDRKLCEGVNVLINNGEVAEQQVGHLHVHIVPRNKEDKQSIYAPLPVVERNLVEIAKKFKL